MPDTKKIDLFKQLKDEYAAPKKPRVIQTTAGKYLSVTGKGAPGGDAYTEKIGALYAAAYTMKFDSKAAGQDYTVGKMEALYWVEAKGKDCSNTPKEKWCWQILIRVPPHQTKRDLKGTIAKVAAKGECPAIETVSLESLNEGQCVQMLHVGPYDSVGDTLAVMDEFLAAQGLKSAGKHHEIYLSDPRRVDPERLRTIVRIPARS